MSDNLSDWKLSEIKQRFSLPWNLIFYMAKNPPSPEVYEKLIQCCKYFWLKNPIITLNSLYHSSRDKHWRTDKMNGFQERQRFKIENLGEKFWIYKDLDVCDHRNRFLASSIVPKIYRCDLTCLWLSYQTLSFDEFNVITSSGSLQWLSLKITTMKNADGSIVSLEKLIELLPNLRTLFYDNVNIEDGQAITSETAAKLIAIPHFPKIQCFVITGIPESFNIETFFALPKVSTSVFN